MENVSIEPNHWAPAATELTAFSKSQISFDVSDEANVGPQPERSASELLALIDGTTGLPPFEHIATLALDHFDEVIDILELDGKYEGKEFTAHNPKRDDGNLGSFKINSQTGVFKDFAVDDCGGGDLIALAAYCWGCSNSNAARRRGHHNRIHRRRREGCTGIADNASQFASTNLGGRVKGCK